MNKHTPGPWRTAIRRGYVAVMAGPQTDTKAICDCKTANVDYHEQVANCQLIAAAPDLLESLLYYMSQFGQSLEAHGIAYSSAQQEADKLARLAIAKAEGK